MVKTFLIAAGLLGAAGVALGAFSAHGLSAYFAAHPGTEDTFRTGVQHHLVHAATLIGAAWAGQHPALSARGCQRDGDGSSQYLALRTKHIKMMYTAVMDDTDRVISSSLSLSPTKTVTTRTDHFCAALYHRVKLEMLKVDDFASKSGLHLRALRHRFGDLSRLQPSRMIV